MFFMVLDDSDVFHDAGIWIMVVFFIMLENGDV